MSDILEYDYYPGVLKYKIMDEDTDNPYISIVGGRDFKHLEFPEEINGIPVTEIENSAFAGSHLIQDVSFTKNIKTIGSCAFDDCQELSSIFFEEGLLSIGSHAFDSCLITNLELPDSLKSIGAYAFIRTPIESVKFGNNLEYISEGAFFYCSHLKSLSIPDSVRIIYEDILYDCLSLESLHLGKSVSIKREIAVNCFNLKEITTHPDNSHHESVDGILYDLGKNILIRYPAGKTNHSFKMPRTVKFLTPHSFNGVSKLKYIHFSQDSIYGFIDSDIPSVHLQAIHCNPNTQISKFGAANGIPMHPLLSEMESFLSEAKPNLFSSQLIDEPSL